jgi:hypothetical protein
VVKVRATSPVEREDVGSNPTWSINWGPVAQWIERLRFPGRLFPSSSFAKRVQKEKSRFLAAPGMTNFERG